MSNTPHELADDFPDKAQKISALRQTDAHFARLADDYHTINRTVHRAETNIEPVDDLVAIDLRKRRAALKDQIWAILSRP